ncbi:hypothetical protein LHJ74_04515 [Streptomyces sp. N2-109]|uniref:DNA helicase DnaB-like N-terminal domain-containing protein n=1 Tax=Streptomyces gossypii TaxID=2883101 RepID=A0ABT2JMU2_9ACTN|nr:DnaB-like helicase N-terminal domain-containing protein [Streptomyces gossypii]MCT2589202.1 hypothetical protein [Streptomyces gossypii]
MPSDPLEALHGNVRALPGHGEHGGPPADLEAEAAVLGAMLLAADAIADVVVSITPEDYYRPAHETIHRTIVALREQGQPVDPITLTHHLDSLGELNRVGGPATSTALWMPCRQRRTLATTPRSCTNSPSADG